MPILAPFVAAASPSIAAMRWHRRVLIVAAPDAADPALAEQRRRLAGWRKEGADRDLTIVEIVGGHVTGAADDAGALRRRYRLGAGFTVLLIGKDGHEAMRSPRPLAASALQSTIDAMPMRRDGQR